MIESYFRNYVQKLKQTNKIAREKSIPAWVPIIDSVMISFLASWYLSYCSWLFLGSFENTINNAPIYAQLLGISTYFPFIYFGIFLLTILDKISHVIIFAHYQIMKMVFLAITKFDLWYWKKYRKESVLANAIFKSQTKIIGMDRQKKRQITVVFLAIAAVYYLFKLGLV